MTALRAINGHAAHVFKTRVLDLAKQQGITSVADLTRKIYGSDVVSNVYPVMAGKNVLTEAKAKIWAPVLGTTPEDLLEANRPVRDGLLQTLRSDLPAKFKPQVTALKPYVAPLMEKLGLTQKKFTEALGIKNPSMVYGILAGRNCLTENMANRWSAVLGVSADSLLKANQGEGLPEKVPQRALTVPPDQATPSKIASRSSSTSANELHGERFSLVVNANGTARVNLRLDDLPLEKALKIIEVLDLQDLILPTTPRSITHDTRPKRE